MTIPKENLNNFKFSLHMMFSLFLINNYIAKIFYLLINVFAFKNNLKTHTLIIIKLFGSETTAGTLKLHSIIVIWVMRLY